MGELRALHLEVDLVVSGGLIFTECHGDPHLGKRVKYTSWNMKGCRNLTQLHHATFAAPSIEYSYMSATLIDPPIQPRHSATVPLGVMKILISVRKGSLSGPNPPTPHISNPNPFSVPLRGAGTFPPLRSPQASATWRLHPRHGCSLGCSRESQVSHMGFLDVSK